MPISTPALQSLTSGWSGMAVLGVTLLLAGGGLWWGGRRWRKGPGGPAGRSGRGVWRDHAPAAYEAATLAPESSVHPQATGQQPGERTGAWLAAVPEGFDSIGFLEAAKRNFVLLQSAWDQADVPALAALMTDELLEHIRQQLRERGDRPNRTDVVMLEARLLGVEDLGPGWLASIEFSGMIREEISAGAAPFREVWSLTKPRDGSTGWLLAGVQALQ